MRLVTLLQWEMNVLMPAMDGDVLILEFELYRSLVKGNYKHDTSLVQSVKSGMKMCSRNFVTPSIGIMTREKVRVLALPCHGSTFIH